MKVTRPLLRYFGGKWQLRHWITSYFPPHRFYAEAFAGAASVLLGKEPAPSGEILNDLNREMINLFRVMQDDLASMELVRRLDWTPYAAAELDLALEPTTCRIERARRMVVRSFFGIEVAGLNDSKSGIRKTGFRMGNVDLGRLDLSGKRTFRNCARDWANWKSALQAIRERLGKVMICERDALEFLRLMNAPDCLVYVDPPYDHAARTKTRYAVEFVDHAGLCAALLETRAMVVLSGYATAHYEPLEAAGWRRVEREYRANMSERRRVECLWISPNCNL